MHETRRPDWGLLTVTTRGNDTEVWTIISVRRLRVGDDRDIERGTVYPPGSPEDIQQMLGILNGFFSNKIKAIELFNAGAGDGGTSTGSTFSICHIDGVDDGDGGGKIPDAVIAENWGKV